MKKEKKVQLVIGVLCSCILICFGLAIHWSLLLLLLPAWGVPIGGLVHLKITNRMKVAKNEG